MNKLDESYRKINGDCFDPTLFSLYYSNTSGKQKDRYRKLLEQYSQPMAHVIIFAEFGFQSMREIKYVFIFENHGEVVGVTMTHPLGKI